LYQLHKVNGHVYYIMPVGGSILSAPFVRVAELADFSPVKADGSYHAAGEERLQSLLAALLMAAAGALLYFTARLAASTNASLVIALAGALGTPVWSAASRGMWSHTWNTLLWAIVAYLLLKAAARDEIPNTLLLATVLSWTYFTRPTSAIGIIAVTIYVCWRYRSAFLPYAAAGAAWFALFLYWSWSHFGAFFPEYYQAGRLDFSVFGTALAGQLISPGRGLLVYVPALFFLAYLLARGWRDLPHKPLAALALACAGGQLFSAAAYPHWWGGTSYGPRFLTETVVWFALLAALATRKLRLAELAAGALLLAVSLFMNGRGAASWDAWRWNSVPAHIDQTPQRLWDWRQPPFLAGLQTPPRPDAPQLSLPAKIDVTSEAAAPFLWYGWSATDPQARWSERREAAILFNLKEPAAVTLSINLGPHLIPGQLAEQRATVELNGVMLDTLRLNSDTMETYNFQLRREWFTAAPNVLKFKLPDAAAPNAEDHRLLGVRVAWLELK
jgi:hypothetical protein